MRVPAEDDDGAVHQADDGIPRMGQRDAIAAAARAIVVLIWFLVFIVRFRAFMLLPFFSNAGCIGASVVPAVSVAFSLFIVICFFIFMSLSILWYVLVTTITR